MDEDSLTYGQHRAKRPGHSNGEGPTSKKRAPYASRACDACRQRKGKCSGGDPCTYCHSRALHCGGAVTARSLAMRKESGFPDSGPLATPTPSLRSRSSGVSAPGNSYEAHEWGRPSNEGLGTNPNNSNSSKSLEHLVSNLQDQVGALMARINHMESEESPRRDHSLAARGCDNSNKTASPTSVGNCDNFAGGVQRPTPRRPGKSLIPRKRFCGPTSPDYSLNVAQLRMHQGLALQNNEDTHRPFLDDNESYEVEASEDDPDDEMDETFSILPSDRETDMLTGFTRLLTKHETLRLMHVYQETFGDYHPILDVANLRRQAEDWYDQSEILGSGKLNLAIGATRLQDVTLLKINLVLAIALCTEPRSNVDVGKALFSYCRDAIHGKIVLSLPAIDNAVIALLLGTYHFFDDNAQLAWRMCGLAGNMLLELGLHNCDFHERKLGSEHERARTVNIICTTIVLDRQWSAATGFPTHFKDSYFHHAMKSSVETPYLRAMVLFMAVSDKFTSPISRITTTSQPYEEDDAFEVLHFQIEQWRNNAVGRYSLKNSGGRRRTPINQIPAWAILLNLRANAAHSMLLRPFFFTKKPTTGSRNNIQPAVGLFADTISILSDLDQLTDVYRKQQPFYLHLLVSACALMALVVVHVAQHHATLSPNLPDGFAESIRKSYGKALNLATAYSESSRASRKLMKRLHFMRQALRGLGILPEEAHGQQEALCRQINPQHMHKEQQQRLSAEGNVLSRRLEGHVQVSATAKAHVPPTLARHADHVAPHNESQSALATSFLRNTTGVGKGYRQLHAGGKHCPLPDSIGDCFVPDLGAVSEDISATTQFLEAENLRARDENTEFALDTSLLGDWLNIDAHTFFSEGELVYDG